MKIKFLSNIEYQLFPITEDMIDITEEEFNQIGITRQYDPINKIIIDYDNSSDKLEELKYELQLKRERICFSIINRGQAWYDTLTEQQKLELQVWYQAWLDVTETLVEPTKPEWLK